jgi:long-subunit fatty acid transport protein
MTRATWALALIASLAVAQPAFAGGYDTPILYSARHQGMGGTAIGYVDDASSIFHNPAGLAKVESLNVLAGIDLLFGKITTSPGNPDLPKSDGTYPSRTTEPAVAPLFIVGAGYHLAPPIVVGLGVYPIAAISGEYATPNVLGRPTIDKTKLVFLEISPAVAVRLADKLSVGAGYRATISMLDRVKGDADNPREFDFSVKGTDFTGLRVGAQWQPIDMLSVGLVYRHRIQPKLHADRGYAYTDLTNAETTLTLPSKLGAGVAAQLDALKLAFDLEYGFYSQNGTSTLSGYNPTLNKTEQVTNYFEWQNAVTARLGGEYGLGAGKFPVRLGYVFDGQVGNRAYPSAFGTPPTPSHSITAGAGYRAGKWQANVAGAYRFASTSIAPSEVSTSCAVCSKPGSEYSLQLIALYLDFSIDFDLSPRSAAAPTEPTR